MVIAEQADRREIAVRCRRPAADPVHIGPGGGNNDRARAARIWGRWAWAGAFRPAIRWNCPALGHGLAGRARRIQARSRFCGTDSGVAVCRSPQRLLGGAALHTAVLRSPASCRTSFLTTARTRIHPYSGIWGGSGSNTSWPEGSGSFAIHCFSSSRCSFSSSANSAASALTSASGLPRLMAS